MEAYKQVVYIFYKAINEKFNNKDLLNSTFRMKD